MAVLVGQQHKAATVALDCMDLAAEVVVVQACLLLTVPAHVVAVLVALTQYRAVQLLQTQEAAAGVVAATVSAALERLAIASLSGANDGLRTH